MKATKRLLVLGYALFGCALFTIGCTTHETKFKREAPPRPSTSAADSTRAADAASQLIQRYQPKIISQSTESLATFGQASALLFEATGAPGLKAAASDFADTLLEARLPVAGGQAFFSSTSGGQPDLETTTNAGNALIDIYHVTGDQRYLAAAQSAARAATSRRMGWVPTGKGFAARTPTAHSLYNIALTADVALFAKRAASVGTITASAKQADSAFHFIAVHQAAVGRWYLNVGAKTPMNLPPWAGTLLALASTRKAENQGIVGGGVAGIWSDAFTDSGTARHSLLVDQRGLGVALSLRLFQRFAGTTRDADLAYGNILTHRRPDGTVEAARPDDSIAQAYFALAFAERALALRHPNVWYRRLI